MANPTAAAFAERMKLLASQDFGAQYRPGLAAAVANGSASPEQMLRIASFITALDKLKVAQANGTAGFSVNHSPYEKDLLNSVGQPNAIVQRANSTVQASADQPGSEAFLTAAGATVSRYLGNSGSLVFPQPASFADPNKAPDGQQRHEGWLMTALDTIANVPGFIYRFVKHDNEKQIFAEAEALGVEKDRINAARRNLGLDQLEKTQKAMGYDPTNFASDTAFLWSHGEADFVNLDKLKEVYGEDAVNTALGIYYNKSGYGGNFQDALASYRGNLEAAVRSGKLSPEDYAAEIQRLSSSDFETVYKAVDRQHVSFGRDLARMFMPDAATDPYSRKFDLLSGAGDFAWTIAADPTLVGGKALHTIRMAKYGAEALADSSNVARLYGVADKATGEVARLNPVLNAGAIRARANVTDFLARNAAIRAASEAGQHTEAAALLAQNAARHADLMPAYREAQGWRVAWTPEQIAASRAEGTVATLGGDSIHDTATFATLDDGRLTVRSGAELPIIKSKPIESLDEWVEWLTDQGGMYRMFSGLAPNQLRMLPGRMGFAGEARAALVAKHAYSRTANGLNKSRLPGLAAGESSVLDYLNDADKLIASDHGEAFKKAFLARGAAQADRILGVTADAYWLRVARQLKAKSEQSSRRLSTALPTNSLIAFSSAQAGRDIERFARLTLPKYEASLIRYMWEQAPSEAARRQIGKSLINEVIEASGLTRTVYGRQWLEEFNRGWDNWTNRRYDVADTDVIPDALNGGDKRVALHMSQIETALVLPSWRDMRVAAAKGAILGFDKQLGDITAHGFSGWFTTAAGDKDVWGGVLNMLASPTATIRYGLFNGAAVQRLFGLMKLGWLATTSNTLRQLGEEYVGIKASGHGSELRLGKRAQRLSGDTHRLNLVAAVHHLIPRAERAAIETDADVNRAIARGRFRVAFGDAPLNPAQERALGLVSQRIIEPETLEVLGGRIADAAEGGVDDAVMAHNGNVQMARMGWKTPDRIVGYKQKTLDGDAGRKALAKMYVDRFYDYDEPARRALAYLMWNRAAEDGAFLAKLDEDTLARMQELVPVDDLSYQYAVSRGADAPGVDLLQGAGYEDAAGHIVPPSTDAIKGYVLNDERTARFRQRAEILRTDESGHTIASDDRAALDAAADRYVKDHLIPAVTAVIHDRAGTGLNAELTSNLLVPGRIPSESELHAFDLSELPHHVVAAEYAPAPKIQQFGQRTQAFASRAYDFIVTNPMRRLERKPLFIGNYVKAFERLQPYEGKLVVEHGFRPDEAERILDNMAYQQALHDTLRHIDNPKIASQFSVVAQNFWLFYRAQEDWMRRWSRLLKERPEMIRMAHGAIISGQNSGIIDRDSDGSLIFSYPGSGATIEAIQHVAHALGWGDDVVKLPVVHDLTSQVNYLNPSLMNPVGFSATPMLSIPFRFLSNLIPGGEMLKAEADYGMEGALGNGRSWYEQFMPTQLNRFINVFKDPENTRTWVGSATATALQNASLAGLTPREGDDIAAQDFVTSVTTQALGAVFLRSLFSFVAPGAPSLPELDYTNDKGELGDPEADFAWRVAGVEHLSDEYKAMIQAIGWEKAQTAWTILHPDKLVYGVGKTEAPVSGADIPVTFGATGWIFDHMDLFQGPYRRAAVYFIPNASGAFDQIGWNTMTEIGIRQYKSTEDYYLDVVTKNATREWFDEKDKYTLAKNAARNKYERDEVNAAYEQKKADLYQRYPILRSYFPTLAASNKRQQIVDELTRMVQDPTVNLPALPGVAQMLIVQNNYNQQLQAWKGQRSTEAASAKQELLTAYTGAMQEIVAKYPDLQDLYQGVFRLES